MEVGSARARSSRMTAPTAQAVLLTPSCCGAARGTLGCARLPRHLPRQRRRRRRRRASVPRWCAMSIRSALAEHPAPKFACRVSGNAGTCAAETPAAWRACIMKTPPRGGMLKSALPTPPFLRTNPSTAMTTTLTATLRRARQSNHPRHQAPRVQLRRRRSRRPRRTQRFRRRFRRPSRRPTPSRPRHQHQNRPRYRPRR